MPFYLSLIAGIACERLGRFDEAIPFYCCPLEKAVAEADPIRHEEAATGLVRTYYHSGSFTKAIELIRSLPAQVKEKAFLIWVTASCLQYEVEEDESALSAIWELVTRCPDCPGPRLNLALRLALSGDVDRAVKELDKEAGRSPLPMLAFVKGVCQRIGERWADALRTLLAGEDSWRFHWSPWSLSLPHMQSQTPSLWEKACGLLSRSWKKRLT